MKTIQIVNLLAILGLSIPAMSQTLSGYVDGGPAAVDSKSEISEKPMRLQFPGAKLEGWQATLRLSTNAFKVGDNIEVQIAIKNVSRTEMALSTAWPLLANGFNFRVMDKDKVGIPLTSFGESQRASGAASPNISRKLLPDEEMVFSIDLQRVYQVTRPGTYTIQASRLLPSKEKPGNLHVETGVAEINLEAATNAKAK